MARCCGKKYGFCKRFSIFCKHFSFFCDQILKEVVYSFFKKICRQFFCVLHSDFFNVIFNILRKRVKNHTCLFYAIITLCNCYIVVS